MDTFSAFARGAAARSRGAKLKVFDWDKAAQIIKDRKLTNVSAGLSSDLEYTMGLIYDNGPVKDSYTYLASIWATPVLVLKDGEEIPCWSYEDDRAWDSGTKWPESSLKILNK